ncbi:MAG: hypothetical protein JWR26_3851 [Pedosphaera sp.]|nr:hypothetical protein [Pedosphaera sp.]
MRTANDPVTLRFEGRLIGPWVGEAREACETFLGEGSALKLNLYEVSFADQDGLLYLKSLVSRGVTLAGCSPFVEEQLKSMP